MEIKEIYKGAGNLDEELQEIESIFLNNDSVVAPASAMTDICATFITILCC